MAKKKRKSRKNEEREIDTNPFISSKKLTAHNYPSSLIRRNLLIVITFCSGASIMIIELAANRVLSPWFGNSLYTWTGLIGVILVALSCGYYFGGWLVDRRPNYLTLIHLLTLSSFLILLVPLFQYSLNESFSQKNIIMGPILVSLLLFALPGCTLASIYPFAIRLISLSTTDKQIGISAGFIGMCSTFGSVIGTFLTGFVLIPHMGIRTIFFVIAGGLLLLSIVGYILFLNKWKFLSLIALLLLFFVIIIYSYFPKKLSHVLFEQNTFYHRIKVVQKMLPNGDRLKTIYLDSTVEGQQFEKSRRIPIAYQQYWELAKLFCTKIEYAAFLGGGAFTMPESLIDAYPDTQVDVIELDQRVIEVGRLFFRVNEYPKMRTIASDARRYLKSSTAQYDLIFGDAYNGVRYIPAHLTTVEFFNLVKNRLNENGIYMMNIISAVKGKHSKLFRTITKTIRTAFQHVYIFAINPNRLQISQNIIIVASDKNLTKIIKKTFSEKEENRLTKLIKTYIPTNRYDITDAPLLTDDYNPVESIVAKSLVINNR